MKREIEFRGKTIDGGDWEYGDLMQIPRQNWTSIFGQLPTSANSVVDSETVGQYTGLKDHAGTKIFDGDIVMMDGDNEEVGTVLWDVEESMYLILSDRVYMQMGEFISNELEVIGNIHDNPELLEVSE